MPSAGINSPTDRGVRQPEDLTASPTADSSGPGRRTGARRYGLGLFAGLAIALSLPPWGWWPLAFVGTAALSQATASSSRRTRFWVGSLTGAAWLLLGMAWMWFLTPPGYVIAGLLFASFHGVAAALTPNDPLRVWVGPLWHTLAEVIRFSFPFGGVPLATLAMSASSSPLLSAARVGGAILLTWMVLQIGFGIAVIRARPRAGTLTIAAVVVALFAAMQAPAGRFTGRLVEVAVVQGGGAQGTTALEVPAADVFAVHLAATRTIEAPTASQIEAETAAADGSSDRAQPALALVIWPENGVGMPRRQAFADSVWRDQLAGEAARLGVPILVGLTEDLQFSNHPTDADSFVNSQLVVYPDGSLGDRYEKVHIVPFGEYVPLRGLLTALGVDLTLIGRDATRGQDPAQLRVELTRPPAVGASPVGSAAGTGTDESEVTVGVMISWEVFFGNRGRAAVANDAEFLLNPTNGSSYTWTILQSQQIASSRLRAAETGRWVVQDSPTGFSAFISPSGDVIDRTDIGEHAVIRYSVPLRTGTTVYTATGDAPWVILLLVGLAATSAIPRLRQRRFRSTALPDHR